MQQSLQVTLVQQHCVCVWWCEEHLWDVNVFQKYAFLILLFSGTLSLGCYS